MVMPELKDEDVMQLMLGIKGVPEAAVLFEIGLDGEPEVMCQMDEGERVSLIDMLEDMIYALEMHTASALC